MFFFSIKTLKWMFWYWMMRVASMTCMEPRLLWKRQGTNRLLGTKMMYIHMYICECGWLQVILEIIWGVTGRSGENTANTRRYSIKAYCKGWDFHQFLECQQASKRTAASRSIRQAKTVNARPRARAHDNSRSGKHSEIHLLEGGTLICRVWPCPWTRCFLVCWIRVGEPGARSMQSHQEDKRVLRRRAGVSMVTPWALPVSASRRLEMYFVPGRKHFRQTPMFEPLSSIALCKDFNLKNL